MKKKVDALVVVKSLQAKANPIGKKLSDLEVKTQSDFEHAGKLVKQHKEMKSLANDRKKEMNDPIRQALGAISKHFKPFEEWVDEMEADTKMKMSVFLEKLRLEEKKLAKSFDEGKIKKVSTYVGKTAELKQQAVSQFSQTREVDDIQVDINKLPKEYTTPDMTKIKADLKAGKKIPGVTVSKKQIIAI